MSNADAKPHEATVAQPPGANWPTPEEVGAVGAFYVSHPRRWVRRHVESIELDSDHDGRRRLTIDVVLPQALEASFPWRDGTRLFYLPLLYLPKKPALADIDFTDERGHTLPVTNRLENARVSSEAVVRASTFAFDLDGVPRARLRSYLKTLVFQTDRRSQETLLANSERLLEATEGKGNRAEALRVRQAWRDLAVDSLVWIPIIGTAGERRVLKFSHTLSLERPGLIPRRGKWIDTSFELEGESRPSKYWEPGDGNERGIFRRLANRLGTAIGWGGYDVSLPHLYDRHCNSYHLQFRAPEGLEVRRARLHSEIVNVRGKRMWPSSELTRSAAHIYFAGLRVKRAGRGVVTLRVGRRGFLTLAAFSCLTIALMLRAFARYPTEVEHDSATAAAIALVIPVLLTVLTFRPGEHALAAKMLGGVRAFLLIEGLLAAMAAGAIIGILPFGVSTRQVALRDYADIASTLAAAVSVSWLLSLDGAEKARRQTRRLFRRRYAFGVGCLVAPAVSAAVTFALGHASAHGTRGWLRTGILATVALTAAWVATFAGEDHRDVRLIWERRQRAVMCGWSAVASVVAALISSGYDFGLVSWSAVRTWVPWVFVVMATGIVATWHLRDRWWVAARLDIEDEEILDWST